MLRQSNLASIRRGPFYMFGIQVPRSDHEADALDTHNGNTKLDITELLDNTGIIKYQSLIGALQWVVTLGCFNVLIAVCTMSTYRVAPCVGHLDRLKRMFGYLRKHQDGAVRINQDARRIRMGAYGIWRHHRRIAPGHAGT
jgi:hypothetical protein